MGGVAAGQSRREKRAGVRLYPRVKRCLDMFVSGVLLLLLSPLLAAIALAIRVSDGSPVLFRQRRLGRNARLFEMLKFRTMAVNAPDLRNPDGTTVNSRTDSRVTTVGRWLRRTSLDELPQLVNVLRGEMSLVGGRPDLPEALGRYTPAQRRRLGVRPGMTGWAVVNGRNAVRLEDRWDMDAWYAEHATFSLDMVILARTLVVAVTGRGFVNDQRGGKSRNG